MPAGALQGVVAKESTDMPIDTGIRLTVRSVDALTAKGRDTMF